MSGFEIRVGQSDGNVREVLSEAEAVSRLSIIGCVDLGYYGEDGIRTFPATLFTLDGQIEIQAMTFDQDRRSNRVKGLISTRPGLLVAGCWEAEVDLPGDNVAGIGDVYIGAMQSTDGRIFEEPLAYDPYRRLVYTTEPIDEPSILTTEFADMLCHLVYAPEADLPSLPVLRD